jgi:hypothetical protein
MRPSVTTPQSLPLSPFGTAPLGGEPFLGRESCGCGVRTDGMRKYYTKKLIPTARQMRGNPTPAERKLWYELVISGSLGLRVVRFTNDEVTHRFGSVCSQIQAILLFPERAPLRRRSLPDGWGAVPQGLRGRAREH